MATTLPTAPAQVLKPRAPQVIDLLIEAPLAVLQTVLALTSSLPALRVVRPILTSETRRGWLVRLVRSLIALFISTVITQIQVAVISAVVFAAGLGLWFALDRAAMASFDLTKFRNAREGAEMIVRTLITVVTILVNVLLDRPFLDSFSEFPEDMPALCFLLRLRIGLTRALIRVGATMILMGLSLLPLAALLVALPAANPAEAVLTESLAPSRSRLRNLLRRIGGLLMAAVLLAVLLAFAVEIVTRLHLPGDTFYGIIIQRFLPEGLAPRLPFSLVQHWPYVLFIVYLLDLGVLILIGKVPLSYNLRNLVVRWHITALTALAFIVVLFMLTFMLSFVNGITKLTEQSGVPGNVLVMSDGATDELFSNLGYGDIDNVERIVVTEDTNDQPLTKPVAVKKIKVAGKTKALGSRETYCVVNQIIPGTERRRFVQLRIIVDADVSAAVHNLELVDKRHEWFTTVGVDDQSRVQCVLGQGVASTIAADLGKKSLEPGDTFELADLTWVVTGIMKTEGTTFGSEVWCSNLKKVIDALGKHSYTTFVMRVNDESEEGARMMAYHIRNRYQTQKLKAVPEKEYFADLNKNNQQTTIMVIIVAVVMAIGGIFGIMNTMYAAIAQRTKDIGILRLLGFKRWQVLVSFLLESMTIALIGGTAGVLLGSLCDGFAVTSIASAGGGGGKSVAAKLIVDRDVYLIGILFTLAMGRLGGLVPALSAMRLKILESLR